MSEQPPVRRVMISSTALDLPEHRKHARDARERMSMLPLVMEQMPASPAYALTLSRRYVGQADFYLGSARIRGGIHIHPGTRRRRGSTPRRRHQSHSRALALAGAGHTPKADQAAPQQDERGRLRNGRRPGASAPRPVDADVIEAIEPSILSTEELEPGRRP
jgi:hypothetical protein